MSSLSQHCMLTFIQWFWLYTAALSLCSFFIHFCSLTGCFGPLSCPWFMWKCCICSWTWWGLQGYKLDVWSLVHWLGLAFWSHSVFFVKSVKRCFEPVTAGKHVSFPQLLLFCLPENIRGVGTLIFKLENIHYTGQHVRCYGNKTTHSWLILQCWIWKWH